nr:TetR/AcrR family transcriptional regulator [uncultured Niameybacter sp.]
MPKQTFDNLQEDKKQRIIQSALVEFIDKGYEKGNIEVIAKSAGVSKGSMYQYFINKKDLYIYLVEYVIKLTQDAIKKYMNEENVTDIYDLFYEGNKALWPVMNQYINESLFVERAQEEADLEIRQAIKDLSGVYTQHMYIPIIEEQKRAGKIRTDIDSEMILLYLEGVSIRFKRHVVELARKSGKNMLELEFETFDQILCDMRELLRNGMLGK